MQVNAKKVKALEAVIDEDIGSARTASEMVVQVRVGENKYGGRAPNKISFTIDRGGSEDDVELVFPSSDYMRDAAKELLNGLARSDDAYVEKKADLPVYAELSGLPAKDFLRAAREIEAEYATKIDPDEVRPGDLVDFGPYGQLYVPDPTTTPSGNWWVTDEESERYNPDAQGWYIKPFLAEEIVERG